MPRTKSRPGPTSGPLRLLRLAEPHPALGPPSTDKPTVSDIRILDPNRISATFVQQQQIKSVYGFAKKLDIDRYTMDGVTKDYIVGVRELSSNNLQLEPDQLDQQHTVYTHGYGLVAAAASPDVTNTGQYTPGDIPQTGPLTLSKPDLLR